MLLVSELCDFFVCFVFWLFGRLSHARCRNNSASFIAVFLGTLVKEEASSRCCSATTVPVFFVPVVGSVVVIVFVVGGLF